MSELCGVCQYWPFDGIRTPCLALEIGSNMTILVFNCCCSSVYGRLVRSCLPIRSSAGDKPHQGSCVEQ